MRNTVIVLISFVSLLLMSFKNIKTTAFTGTYGIDDSEVNQVKLVINPDDTFYYSDLSNPGNKISVTGKWELRSKKLSL